VGFGLRVEMVRVELLMGEMTARMHACTLNPQLSSDPTMRGRRLFVFFNPLCSSNGSDPTMRGRRSLRS
jgi:hypothetical protein